MGQVRREKASRALPKSLGVKLIKFILKIFGIIVIAFTAVMSWHIGTTMDPQEEHNIALSCVLSAQMKIGEHGQEILQSHSTKLFTDVKSWVQVLNKKDGTKSEIYCIKRNGGLRFLYVNGKEIN